MAQDVPFHEAGEGSTQRGVASAGQIAEWALAKWGLDPDAVADRLTYPQLHLLWIKGQERTGNEWEMSQAAVREGMTDVYVALKQLKRTGSKPGAKPAALEGAQLEQVLMGMAQRFPNNVTVVKTE